MASAAIRSHSDFLSPPPLTNGTEHALSASNTPSAARRPLMTAPRENCDARRHRAWMAFVICIAKLGPNGHDRAGFGAVILSEQRELKTYRPLLEPGPGAASGIKNEG